MSRGTLKKIIFPKTFLIFFPLTLSQSNKRNHSQILVMDAKAASEKMPPLKAFRQTEDETRLFTIQDGQILQQNLQFMLSSGLK
jgi:hypothetical protein